MPELAGPLSDLLKNILIYAQWIGMVTPELMDILTVSAVRGKDIMWSAAKGLCLFMTRNRFDRNNQVSYHI
jgi:hypothetical protein